ncbi:hypothetical protein F2Q69_00003665 [Brassica cretica]|uniref:F-box associated beta-propeller type 1 domain-containing protein n=2 Tax=Brassica cretica TaxID=69181 RepID=A0A8S9P203_BRACR|nr:hypothetical protein F2Q69_00003665 [Brassica cretica]KAF3542918.1 hypothetical protein DY000_02004451 [Brassica cretica]
MVTPKLPWDLESEILSRVPPTSLKRLQTTKDKNLVVWNPCTGQTRWILSNDYAMNHMYYLGYGNKNKSCDSLKLLRLSYYYHQRQRVDTFEMYEFNSDSWRAFHDDAVSGWKLSSRGVSLKGNTYWLYSDAEEEDDLVNCILIFDFTTERFGRLSLPFHNDDNDAGVVLSVVREEKLALLFQSFATYSPSEMKIWVTNTKADEAKELSWSLFLVVDYTKVTEAMTRVICFLVDEENKRVMFCLEDNEDEERTIIHVGGEDIHKIVYSEYIPKPKVINLDYKRLFH